GAFLFPRTSAGSLLFGEIRIVDSRLTTARLRLLSGGHCSGHPLVAAEPRYAGSPAVAPGEVVPLTSRAERRASRRRSARSFPAQMHARAPPWHATRYSAPARRHEA